MGAIISEGRWVPNKTFKIITGLLSFFIFVGGMGLIARLGFKHGEAFPAWIMIKIGMWLVFNISLVCLFRVEQKKFKIAFTVMAFLSVFIAVFTAVTKLA